MNTALFVIGAATSIGCGWNIMVTSAPFRYEVIWLIGGTVGAVMMVAAIMIERGAL